MELALLKGRHPLLRDVDITINPSKGLALVKGKELGGKVTSGRGILATNDTTRSYLRYKNEDGDNFFEDIQSDILNGFHVDQFKNMLEKNEDGEKSINGLQSSASVNADLVNGGDSPLDNERSQSIQAAEFVMNMLDATAPVTLAEEQKKKVSLYNCNQLLW